MENGFDANSAASSSSCYPYPYVNPPTTFNTFGTYQFPPFYGTYESGKYHQQATSVSNQYYHDRTQTYYSHYRAPVASTFDYANLFLNGAIPNNYSSAPSTATAINRSGNDYRFSVQRPKYAWMLEREKDHRQSRHCQQTAGATTDTVTTAQTGHISVISKQ